MNKGKIRDSAFKDLDLVYMLYTQLKCPTLHWLDVKVLRFLVYGLPFRLSECQLSALAQLSCAQRLEWILMQKIHGTATESDAVQGDMRRRILAQALGRWCRISAVKRCKHARQRKQNSLRIQRHPFEQLSYHVHARERTLGQPALGLFAQRYHLRTNMMPKHCCRLHRVARSAKGRLDVPLYRCSSAFGRLSWL